MIDGQITVNELESGDMELVADNDARRALEELRDENKLEDIDILHVAMEDHWTNGEYQPFDAGDGNPFVGLTCAPCIAESISTLDDGENIIDGRFWYYADYMSTCFIDILVDEGRVVFTLHKD